MTASVRDAEARAIAMLIDAHLNGPPEWGPEHHDLAEAAARTADAWRRRDGRNPSAPPKVSHPKRAEGNEIPQVSRDAVRARSRGRCEANTPACRTDLVAHLAVLMHHIAGRWDHSPENLLHVCTPAHVYIHAHPAESYRTGWMRKRNGLAAERGAS